MRLILDKVRWKNFFNTGEYFNEVDLSCSKSTIVIGPNGVGKTTLLEAIVFGLYGRSYRKLPGKLSVINSITKKNCVVEVEFHIHDSNYKIVRGLKPHIFDIFKNGEKLNKECSLAEQQTFFENNILRISYKTFIQCIILGVSRFIPFMDLSSQDRRDIVEDILDIQIFQLMQLSLKEELTSYERSAEELKMKIKLIENTINNQQLFISKLKKQNKDYNNQIKDKIKLEIKTIEDINIKIKEVEEHLVAVIVVDSNQYDRDVEVVRSLSEKLIKYKLAIEQLNKENKLLSNDICPLCGQSICGDLKEKYKKNCKVIDKAKSFINKYKIQKDHYDILISEYTNARTVQYKLEKELNQLQCGIEYILSNIENLKKMMKENISIVDLSTEVKKLEGQKEQLDLLVVEYDKLNYVIGVYNISVQLLKDDGIKSKLIETYLPYINQRINYYLGLMDFYIGFKLDGNFNEQLMSVNRKDQYYENFSAGEKLRLDIALMLVWRDVAILKNSVDVNILFFDELLDCSLDEDGIGTIFKVLSSLKDTNLFVISHKHEFIDKFERVLSIRKSNNFSVIS